MNIYRHQNNSKCLRLYIRTIHCNFSYFKTLRQIMSIDPQNILRCGVAFGQVHIQVNDEADASVKDSLEKVISKKAKRNQTYYLLHEQKKLNYLLPQYVLAFELKNQDNLAPSAALRSTQRKVFVQLYLNTLQKKLKN